jgi:hypothetical protein
MKYCKTCKEPFEPKQKFNSTIKTNRCEVCLKTAQALKNLSAIKKEKKIKQKEDLLTLQDYLKLTQQVFNSWIRKRDAGKPCISCKKVIVGKTDAGHMYSVGNYPSVRFNEKNVHSQCINCNRYNGGRVNDYRINFILEYSQAELDELDKLAHQSIKYNINDLKELIKIYKEKIKEMQL